MKKKSIFSKISTMPSPDSLKWAGEERSILSSILLWGLWICRVFSLLQICKLIFRTVATAIKRATTDKNATRVNVPPMFCEIYFLSWFTLLLLAHLLEWSSIVIKIFIIYYLFESVVWVLYYTVFRRFYEENYSIYHELEYLTELFLVIPTQALGFATIYNESFRNMISGLLGAGLDDTPFPVRILGALFAAIVISMIISAFPAERVKKRARRDRMIVIGGGDVVRKRLYPSMLSGGVLDGDIEIYDLVSSQVKTEKCTYLLSGEAIGNAVDEKITSESIVWIESPTSTHVDYLKRFISSKAPLIVLEKPVCATRDDLNYIEELLEDEILRPRVFFLSYYVLEKALPLYYIADQNSNYHKYLDIEDKALMQNCLPLLGALTSIEVSIIEGEDDREWAFDKSRGGQMLETFIHNLLIASLFCGTVDHWSDVSVKEGTQGGVYSINMSAKSGNTDISLSLKKNAPKGECVRFARLNFSNGYIYADLEEKKATVYFASMDKESTVSVKHKFIDKYSVMIDLARRTANGDCYAEEVDGIRNQIPTIRWIIDYNEKNNG